MKPPAKLLTSPAPSKQSAAPAATAAKSASVLASAPKKLKKLELEADSARPMDVDGANGNATVPAPLSAAPTSSSPLAPSASLPAKPPVTNAPAPPAMPPATSAPLKQSAAPAASAAPSDVPGQPACCAKTVVVSRRVPSYRSQVRRFSSSRMTKMSRRSIV